MAVWRITFINRKTFLSTHKRQRREHRYKFRLLSSFRFVSIHIQFTLNVRSFRRSFFFSDGSALFHTVRAVRLLHIEFVGNFLTGFVGAEIHFQNMFRTCEYTQKEKDEDEWKNEWNFFELIFDVNAKIFKSLQVLISLHSFLS